MHDMTRVIEFVLARHGDQMYGVLPFIVHPLAVAHHFTDYRMKTIALLHDVLEDTPTEYSELRDVFGTDVADAVDALTRRKTETYEEYIVRCSDNLLAREVKIADLRENIFDMDNFQTKFRGLFPRYQRALEFLLGSYLS